MEYQIDETALHLRPTRRGYENWHHGGKSFFGRTEISLDVPASLRTESKQHGGFLASRSPVGNLKHPAVSVRKLEPMRFTISRSFVCLRDRQFRLPDALMGDKRLTESTIDAIILRRWSAEGGF